MKNILLLIFCFLCIHGLRSQISFEKTYELEGSGYKEYGMSVMQDDEGRYVSAVYCSYANYDFQRAEIFRTDQYGEFIDSDVFFIDSQGYDSEFEVLPGNHGGNPGYVLGTTTRTYPGTNSVYYLKYKDYEYQNEHYAWIHVRDHDIGQELILTDQNTYLLLGYSWDDGEDTVIYIGEHADSLSWIQYNVLSSAFNIIPRSAGQLADGSYLITGYTIYPSPRRLYVAHISTELEFIWEKTFNIGTLAINEDLPVCVYGDEISIPHTLINVPMHQSIQLLKINADGDSLGSFIVADGLDIDCMDVIIEDNGDIVMTGLEELDGPPRKVILIRTSMLGNVIWKRDYYINQCAAGMSLAKTQDGGYIIAGFSRWPSPIVERPFLIKTDGDGISTWIQSVDEVNPISISPNPATTSVRIKLADNFINGEVSIYDSKGNKLISSHDYISEKEIMISHLPAGLYFVQIKSGKQFYSSKLIKK